MKEPTEVEVKAEPSSPQLVKFEKLFDRMMEISQSVAKRAYEFFEGRGRELGRDLDDWLRAELELLRPVAFEIKEEKEALIVRAEVPGFTAKELEVSIEPRRLVINGKAKQESKKEAEKIAYSEFRSKEVFRMIDLPVEIDTEKTTAVLKDGILELVLPKVEAIEAKQVKVKTA